MTPWFNQKCLYAGLNECHKKSHQQLTPVSLTDSVIISTWCARIWKISGNSSMAFGVMALAYFGTWHFSKRLFGKDISSRDFFGTRRFQHENIFLWHHRGLGTGTFWLKDISAHVHFGIVQSNIDILAQTFRHGCPCAKMFMCRNILVPKSSSAVISPSWKVHGAKKYLRTSPSPLSPPPLTSQTP